MQIDTARIITGLIPKQDDIAGLQACLIRRAFLFLLLFLIGFAISDIPIGNAQTSFTDSLMGFQSGMVTDLRPGVLQINNKDYEVITEVSIKDEEGKPIEFNDIVRNAEVKFHLKQGHIDKIVLILPR
jgi:hypothetical protein